MFHSSKVVNCNKVRHSKEKSDNKGTGDGKRVRDHTEKVRKKNGKEEVKQDSKVLLFANVKVLFYDRAY